MAGITLTSKTINSTYDSLLKLTDNDGLTASFKTITDGLGNDSGISINNAGNVQISGTLNVSGTTTIGSVLRGNATLTIDPAAHGDNTGLVVIAGDLQVDGTTTTINSTTVSIDDKNILLAAEAANKAAANGAGITVETGTNDPVVTDATILYNGTNDTWDFNKWVTASKFVGDLTGDVTGTVSSLSNHDTDDLSEGATNLYYTDTRFDNRFATKDTDDLSEGTTNLYYTTARFNTDFATKDTDDLSEGTTNLYFTDARARGAFSEGTGVTITNGQIAIGQSVGTTDDVTFNQVTADLVGNADSATNADTVDSKHATDFTLDYVTGNNAVTANNITIGSLSATGASFTDPVTIYDSSTSENPRLSVGRSSAQRLQFYVDDRTAIMTHQQDESTGEHAMWYTIDSPTSDADKVFLWLGRAANGSAANTFMTLRSTGLDVDGNITVDDKITITGTTNNLVIDEEADGTWHLYDTFQSNGIKIYSTTGGMEFQYNGNTELTINGSGVVFNGTVDISNANLNIGAADIVFGTLSTNANRGLVWDVDGSYLSKLVSGGTNGGMVEIYTNMGDGITGDVFRIKTGSTASTPFKISNTGLATFSTGLQSGNASDAPDIIGDIPIIRRHDGTDDYLTSIDNLDTFILSKKDGQYGGGTKPSGSHNGTGIISMQTHTGNYYSQLALDTNQNALWIRSANNSTSFGGWSRIYSDGYRPYADNAGTLDGIDSSQFLRSDADDTMSGKLTFAKGSSGTLASRTGYNDFIGYNPSYGSYIGGGASNADRYIYAGGYYWDGSTIHTLIHSGNHTSYTDNKYLRSDTSDTMNGNLIVTGSITSNEIYAQGSQVWSEATQGLTIGTIHIDPASGTDHAGGAITWGASDAANGTNAQAGIYVRSDGSYGTKMYFSTTDSYATGSKTAMSIDQTGLVTINPRLDGAKSFRVYYDMDLYNTVNFTSASWTREGFIQSTGGNGVRIGNDIGSRVWDFNGSNGYLYLPSWLKLGSGDTGIFSDYNGAHFYPNAYSNYGTWRMNGSRGGYGGLLLRDISAKPHIMYDGSGNGGLYNEGNGVWSVYYHVGNNSVGIGGSATLAGYNAYVNGNARATGQIVADGALITTQPSAAQGILGTASFSWGGGSNYPTLYSSNNDRWVMHTFPHVSYLQNGVNGFTGSTGATGAKVRFASDPSASTYWDLGVGANAVGSDVFSIGRTANSKMLITPSGNTKIQGGVSDEGSRRILFPAGGSLEGSSSQTGAIKIGLPTARYGSNTMMTFKVVIYEYSTGETYEYRIGGYNYSDHAWRNVSCIQISDQAPRHQVRWGNDGSRECVWIGETNTGWSYPQVEVMDVTCGFSGESLDGWADGWSLSFVSSFNTVTQTRTPARLGYNINAATIDLDAGTGYPLYVKSNQRYQLGMRHLGISESSYHPWLAHDYASKTTGAYSSMVIHFDSQGDKFWFNRVGDFEADRDIVNNGWYYNRSSVGTYWNSYGYGTRPAGATNSYGNVTTYNAGAGGWDGWTLARSNMSFMGTSSNCGIYASDVGDWCFYYTEVNRGVGLMTSTTSSTYEVYVGGDLYATGDIVAYSDRRVKENIVTIDSALDKVKSLRGVYYNRINDRDKVREIGFIAQEVDEAVPELASYAEDVDEWGVKYAQVTGLHNEAIKELSQKLDEKDQEIANLQAQIDELKQLILNR